MSWLNDIGENSEDSFFLIIRVECHMCVFSFVVFPSWTLYIGYLYHRCFTRNSFTRSSQSSALTCSGIFLPQPLELGLKVSVLGSRVCT